MLKKTLFYLYIILITLLSLWPAGELPDVPLFPYADKFIHAGMYAGFTFLMLWAWRSKLTGIKQLWPFIIVVAWGLFMEIMQWYMHLGRSFDLRDELADCLGFFPGWIGFRWFGNRGTLGVSSEILNKQGLEDRENQ